MSLAWTGLLPSRTADAILDLNLATDFDAFREAARSFAVPAQNLLYADRQGHIGYQAPGQVPDAAPRAAALPRRATGRRPGGTRPTTGRASSSSPSCRGRSTRSTASSSPRTRPSPSRRRPFLTADWDRGWRSARIGERLAELDQASRRPTWPRSSSTPRTPSRRCSCRRCSRCRWRRRRPTPTSDDLLEFTREARELLRGWDFTTPTGDGEAGAAAAYYNAVWRNLLELLFDDELPAGPQGRRRRTGGARRCSELLANPKSAWWDNKLTPNVTEGKDEVLRQALVEARLELTRELGKDPDTLAVGQAAPPHPRAPRARRRVRARAGALAGQRGPVRAARRLVDRQRQRLERQRGLRGRQRRRRCAWSSTSPTSTPRRGSTRPGSAATRPPTHYDDQVDDWVAGRQRPWPFTEDAVRETDPDVLTLTAGGPPPRLSPRSTSPSAVTTASTGWSCVAPRQGWLVLAEHLARVEQDDHRDARAPSRQRAVVAAAALAHPRPAVVDREARGEDEVGGATASSPRRVCRGSEASHQSRSRSGSVIGQQDPDAGAARAALTAAVGGSPGTDAYDVTTAPAPSPRSLEEVEHVARPGRPRRRPTSRPAASCAPSLPQGGCDARTSRDRGPCPHRRVAP